MRLFSSLASVKGRRVCPARHRPRLPGGHTAQARLLVRTAVNGGWLNATAITSGVLLAASAVVAGVAVARTGSLPRAAGIGFAVSVALFVIGAIPDNALQSIAAALMIVSTVWIAAAGPQRDR
jgi:hypothetical protein